MELKENMQVHGFTVTRVTPLPDVDAVGYELTHEQSGARVFYLKCADDNKVFTIGFRTPSQDDTGVAHIMEHSTLCGSRKYHLKEPFVELVKGSLNTFLNAMTYTDKTVYPLASRNDKDFRNLMDVYLDAVFYPLIYENPFTLRQEGWHYEVDEEGHLIHNGVVYNEMKGVYSSADAVEEHAVLGALFPDTPYRFESGGLPEAIPTLTQEKFEAFHKKYYKPENAYIYLYGNMDIDAYLAYLDHDYLSHFHKTPGFKVEIPEQAPFDKTKEVHATYPEPAGESKEHKTYLSLNIVTGNVYDQKQVMALRVLSHVLLNGDNAPLRLAILKAGIGSDVAGSYNTSQLQPVWSIRVSGSDPDKMDQFVSVVYHTLQDISRKGVPEELLTAQLNSEEFKMREADYNIYPKGLIYGLAVMETWLYGGDPTTCLKFTEALDFLRSKIGTHYYENLIETILMDNTHKVLLTLTPEPGKEEKDMAAYQAKMETVKKGLSEKTLKEYKDIADELHARQAAPDSPEALQSIPLLQRSDITRKCEYEKPEITKKDTETFLFRPASTNKISYFDFCFDMTGVPEELLCYAYLLSDVLGKVNTDDFTYEELNTYTDRYIGGLSFAVQPYTFYKDTNTYRNYFKVSAKVLEKNEDKLFTLLSSLALRSHVDDKKRLREIVEEVKSGWDALFFSRGMTVATIRLQSYFSRSSRSAEHDQFTYYKFLQDIVEHFDEKVDEVAANLTTLTRAFFHKDELVMSLSCEAGHKEEALQRMQAFVDTLPESEFAGKPMPELTALEPDEGITTSGKVQYVLAGGNYRDHGYEYTGAMKVLETILRYGYFWTKIRVQGGAYGCGTRFDSNGNVYFSSYRDPKLVETLQVYRDLPEFLEHFEASEREMTKYVIGTISLIDTPLTTAMHLEKAITTYMRGLPEAYAQQTRDEVIDCKAEDIRALAPLVRDVLKDNYYCVVGSQTAIEAHKDLFKSIKKA
ncbi:MAG: insulinase family protein [Acidaminococcus sp.]|jgi:Zn-dependent M16 (insulinase) family peptidase|nr:insulinase family protein [Acidaminococcus sp.]MCI2099481.1 insulinase family protein [Acidaminococcus sp.]MCI2113841.1 insulinase family protein [Acidaminococcus sp.]MCI2115585.1 insulinase family protein [Acidaminococcus sp.]